MLPLQGDDVHIWLLSLDLSGPMLARSESDISSEEAARAGCFALPAHRRRYVAAHALLRRILASYVNGIPRRITMARRPGGKPWLPEHHWLRFNLTRAGGLGLVAVSAGREVGIDLEEIGGLDDVETLAQTCFSSVERAALAAVPDGQRQWAFFAGWTRKEAILKVLGEGLARPLHSFDVSLSPDAPARLLRIDGAEGRHVLRSLAPAPGFVGALAVDGPGVGISWRQWETVAAPLPGGAP